MNVVFESTSPFQEFSKQNSKSALPKEHVEYRFSTDEIVLIKRRVRQTVTVNADIVVQSHIIIIVFG